MKPTTQTINPPMADHHNDRTRLAVQTVRRSFRTGTPANPLPPNLLLTEKEAYQTQYRFLSELQPPETIAGHKIALTTQAARQHLGVHEPCYGHILAPRVYPNNAQIPISSLTAPHIEAEIAFLLAQDLRGPGITPADVLQATQGILPALELVDLKIPGNGIQAADVITHNALHAALILGSRLTPLNSLDLQYEGVTVEHNAQLHATGTAAEVMGHPINPIVWLANKLAEFDDYLRAGETIISGSMVTPAPVQPGDHLQATCTRLGAVAARFTP